MLIQPAYAVTLPKFLIKLPLLSANRNFIDFVCLLFFIDGNLNVNHAGSATNPIFIMEYYIYTFIYRRKGFLPLLNHLCIKKTLFVRG